MKRATGRNSTIKNPRLFALVLCLVALALVLPRDLIQKLDVVGYAVCHRIPERSFIVGGTQLPMCARDTGMFGAALLGILSFALLDARRLSRMPRLPFLAALIGLMGLWAADGFNSYMLLLTGRVFVYMPQNWLRLATGALMGVSLSALVVPLFNQAVWSLDAQSQVATVASWRALLRLMLIALCWIVFVLWQPPFLYGVYALVTTAGTLTLLTVVFGVGALIVARRDMQATTWRQIAPHMLIGFALSWGLIFAVGAFRAWITARYGLPL